MLFSEIIGEQQIRSRMKRKTPPTKTYKTPAKKARTSSAPQAVMMTKSIMPEIHYFDADSDNVGITNIAGASWANCEQDPATLLTLFAPIQGDDIINRQAKRCFVKSVKVKGFVTVPQQTAQTVADGSSITRVILYQSTRTNGTQPQAEEVIASGSATTNNVAAFQNTNGFGKFKILKDKYFQRGNNTIAGVTGSVEQSGSQLPFKFNIKFNKPVEVNFQTNGGTIASVIDNSFHMIAATNNTTLAQTLTYKSRVSFYS